MKKAFIHLFFGERVINKFSAVLAALVISWLLSFLTGAPAFVTTIAAIFLELPEGTEVTSAMLLGPLTAFFVTAINELVKLFVAKDANASLAILKDSGVYDGPLDSWFGDRAKSGIRNLIGVFGNRRDSE